MRIDREGMGVVCLKDTQNINKMKSECEEK